MYIYSGGFTRRITGNHVMYPFSDRKQTLQVEMTGRGDDVGKTCIKIRINRFMSFCPLFLFSFLIARPNLENSYTLLRFYKRIMYFRIRYRYIIFSGFIYIYWVFLFSVQITRVLDRKCYTL